MHTLKLSVTIALSLFAYNADAQLLQKIKNRAENSVSNSVGNAIDKSLDKASARKAEPKKEEAGETAAATPDAAPKQKLQAWSKFDFVPGTQILLFDDFQQDVKGEFPLAWNTNATGEVTQLEGISGNWLKMAQGAIYASPNKQPFPENYTIEFDMIFDMHNKGYGYPELSFILLSTGDADPAGNEIFKQLMQESMKLSLQLGEHNNTNALLRTYSGGRESFRSGLYSLPAVERTYGKPVHFSFSIQKQRIRVWVNEEKLYDLPKAATAKGLNQLAIGISTSNYKAEELGFYFSNLKIAAGLPDTRSKLLETGRWSTTAIVFDTNSDVIKPSSYGALREVAELLKAEPSLRLNIIGHTDADGTKAANQVLSEKRAAAVRLALSKDFSIAEERLQTSGKGASEPVADNSKPEGKAQNRRVEFVKES